MTAPDPAQSAESVRPRWEAGDLVMCRTALGDEVIGTAVSGIVMGRDMQVVWIDFGDRHLLPWPVEAVRAPQAEEG